MIAIPPALARSVLDDAPDAMIIIDEFGTIWFANRQVSALFGYARDEIIGESIEKLMPERFRAEHIGHRGHFVGNIRVRRMGAGLDLIGRRRDGTEFPLEISLSPVEDVGRTLIAAAIRDVSDRKHVEAELLVARDAIEAMRELADRANQGRKRFLEAASHDLRQPLQTLILLNDSLRRLSTDPDAIEAVSQQEQAISEMSRLLNALFDIGQLESGAIKPELTDFQVASFFDGLRAEFTGIAAEKGLQYEIEHWDGWVYSDPSLVTQILRNLISNAIQFTHEGSVRLRCRPDAAVVRIEVLDTGVGIAPEQLPYIFDDFHQVQVPADSSHDGYGLGLSVARRLARLLDLELDVRSAVPGGSVFSLVLPASRDVAVPLRPEHTISPVDGR
jgi:PAS domain S-box-containing protein